jgi:hypothetical protein
LFGGRSGAHLALRAINDCGDHWHDQAKSCYENYYYTSCGSFLETGNVRFFSTNMFANLKKGLD